MSPSWDLEILRSQQIMLKNLPLHFFGLSWSLGRFLDTIGRDPIVYNVNRSHV